MRNNQMMGKISRSPEEKILSYRERAERFLKEYASQYRIFIDISSWMGTDVQPFLDHMEPWLRFYGRKAEVVMAAVEKMEVLAADRTKPVRADRAARALVQIERACREGLVTLSGEGEGIERDSALLGEIRSMRMAGPVLLVTQNHGLASAVLSMNREASVQAFPVKALRTNRLGYLSPIFRKVQVRAAAAGGSQWLTLFRTLPDSVDTQVL